MAPGYGASEMEIIRHAPARPAPRAAGGLGLRIGVPRFHRRAAPWLDALRLSFRQYASLYAWLTLSGACLWPATIVVLASVAPPLDTLMAATPRPSEALILSWYLRAALGAGAVVGAVQWLALRRFIPHLWLWVPATCLGWCAAIGLAGWGVTQLLRWLLVLYPARRYLFANHEWERYALLALVGLLLGVTLGLVQSVTFWRRVSGGWRWIAASAIAWPLALQLVPVAPRLPARSILASRFTGGMEPDLPALALAGALYGLLTAAALAGMLRASIPQPAET